MFNTDHLHPMVVHFPVALIIVAFLSDAIALFIKKENCFHKMGFWLQLLGTLGVVAAVISGDQFTNWETFSGETQNAFELHQDAAGLALWITLAATALRIITVSIKKFNGILKWACLLMLLFAVVLIGRTGFLGGNLVLNYLIGL